MAEFSKHKYFCRSFFHGSVLRHLLKILTLVETKKNPNTKLENTATSKTRATAGVDDKFDRDIDGGYAYLDFLKIIFQREIDIKCRNYRNYSS